MSEKRFTLHLPIDEKDGTMGYIVDHCNKTTYFIRGENARKDLVNLLNEQQATIRRLQDLCGESDGENAKLRIENKKLKDDLHNCRLNKSIIREKLKMWQDVHKEYDIYSIKDFEESFELDAKINKEKGI